MNVKNMQAYIRSAIREDLGRGDVTSRLTVSPGARGRAEIVAKESGILAGVDIAREVFRLFDRKLKVRVYHLLPPDDLRRLYRDRCHVILSKQSAIRKP